MSAVDGWKKVTLMVDSGASDTVIPPSVCSLAQLHHTPKVGIEYECANGAPLQNLGERRCDMKAGDGKSPQMAMAFQVVDVGRASLSVHRVCERGHDVVFSKTKGSFIHTGGDPQQAIPPRSNGGIYEIDVWLRPAGFARPGGR